MSFNPGSYQPTDQEWLVSPASYAHLCQLAAIEVRSRPATARRLVNRFMQLSKRVDYRLSKLEFDISEKPRSIPVTFGAMFRAGEVERVCHAGMFGPDMLLEVALSCRGLKEET